MMKRGLLRVYTGQKEQQFVVKESRRIVRVRLLVAFDNFHRRVGETRSRPPLAHSNFPNS
jgi:hypothetical protein